MVSGFRTPALNWKLNHFSKEGTFELKTKTWSLSSDFNFSVICNRKPPSKIPSRVLQSFEILELAWICDYFANDCIMRAGVLKTRNVFLWNWASASENGDSIKTSLHPPEHMYSNYISIENSHQKSWWVGEHFADWIRRAGPANPVFILVGFSLAVSSGRVVFWSGWKYHSQDQPGQFSAGWILSLELFLGVS